MNRLIWRRYRPCARPGPGRVSRPASGRAFWSLAQVVLVAGLVLLAVAGGAGAVGQTDWVARSAVSTPRLAITGFQSESDPRAAIDRSAAALTTVGVDGVNLQARGTKVGATDAAARAQLARAHADGLRAELLVGNFSERIDDFSERLAHGLLKSPVRIRQIAETLSATVRQEGWNGISLDLESLQARDGAGLVSLVHALRDHLPAGDTVSVNVMNETSLDEYRAAGYALPALGQAASRLILMAYDQHGPWEPTPGPVGALAWQMAGLRALLSRVPADRIDLGQAGYGYVWAPHHRTQLSDVAARQLVTRAGEHPHWSSRAGEWTADLPDRTTVWWSDTRSLALREHLAAQRHLHGLAVWSLGLSDPIRGTDHHTNQRSDQGAAPRRQPHTRDRAPAGDPSGPPNSRP